MPSRSGWTAEDIRNAALANRGQSDEGRYDVLPDLYRGIDADVQPLSEEDQEWERLRGEAGSLEDQRLRGYFSMLTEPLLGAVNPPVGALAKLARSRPLAGALGAGIGSGVGTNEAEAGTLPPGFFSVLETAIRGAKQAKRPGREWAAFLKPGQKVRVGGVDWPLRADELEHSGLYPLLNRPASVTRDELLGQLGQRPLPEVVEFGKKRPQRLVINETDDGTIQIVDEASGRVVDDDVMSMHAAEDLIAHADGPAVTPTHYGQASYSLRGPRAGYEESLTKWNADPARAVGNVVEDPRTKRFYVLDESSEPIAGPFFTREAALLQVEQEGLTGGFSPAARHFDTDNINLLSHSRASTRETPQGRVRVVEELQSDWHQQGREKGYQGTDRLSIEQSPSSQRWFVQYDGPQGDRRDVLTLPPEGFATREEAEAARATVDQSKLPGAELQPPRAPFGDTYHELELRKQLLNAVNAGDDYLALTTGQQQVDRYGDAISQRVHRLVWGKNEDGTFSVNPMKNGVPVTIKENLDNLTPAALRRLLGKDMADRIVSRAEGGVTSGQLSGDDLAVGGTGMRLWYDERGPAYLKRLSEALGGEITEVAIPNKEVSWKIVRGDNGTYDIMFNRRRMDYGLTHREAVDRIATLQQTHGVEGAATVPALKLTPKLRAYVKQHGLPLFSAAGATLFGGKPAMDYINSRREGGGG